MANIKKEIIRDEFFKIRMSKEEKDLFFNFAQEYGINPSRLARNILMLEAKSFINKYPMKTVVKAYKKYLELTDKEAFLKLQKN